jgi:molecular chaperone DnaK (HSP70)
MSSENFSFSLVVTFANSEIIVGDDMQNRADLCQYTYYYDFKRMLGCDYNDTIIQESKKNWTFKNHSGSNREILLEVPGLENETISLVKTNSFILDKLIKCANDRLLEPSNETILIVPPYFNDKQKEDLIEAAKLAKIQPIDFLLESITAAIEYNALISEKDGEKISKIVNHVKFLFMMLVLVQLKHLLC